MKLSSLLLSLFLAGHCFAQSPALKNQKTTPDSLTAYLNIEYAVFDDTPQYLDLYQPTRAGPHPGVVLVHGGGWKKGSRHQFQAMAVELAERGYVVANIDYRLSTEAKFPGAVQDTKAAVRWMRANSANHQIDPNRIAGIGGSAGGHLIAMAALTGHSTQFNGDDNNPATSSELQAAIILGAGVDQFSRAKSAPGPIENCVLFFGGTYQEVPEVYHAASPITHVSKKSPPILMIDGELDRPGERYPDFRKRLDEAGVPNEFLMIPAAKHGQWNQTKFRPQYVEAYDSFLRRHLR